MNPKTSPRRRHGAQLKAQVLRECQNPGASVAAVAQAHGLNANLVHRWRRLAQRASPAATPPAPFIALPLTAAMAAAPQPQTDIRIEVRRGTLLANITWPSSAAQDCGAWLATEPLDMRACTDGALARVVAVFGAAHPHHAYLASESSIARVLRANGQSAHRGRAKAPKAGRPPTTHIATAVRQVWCWDMTYLPAGVLGRWFHLYLILDLYSRKIVGWEVHDSDHSDHAVRLVSRTALAEGIATLADKPVLHGDNGSTLKATTVLSMLNWLGVKPSYSRPRVRDDNAYVESLFRTAKYRPEFPAKGFADLAAARAWPHPRYW